MLRKILGLSIITAVLVMSACSSDSVPTGPQMSRDFTPSAAVVQNEWQTWPMDWTSGCTGRHYVGTYNIHLVSQNKTAVDGTQIATQRFNVAGGVLTDITTGNEYIFQNIGDYSQVTLPSGSYNVSLKSPYMIISKGSEQNEFVIFNLTISWDGTNFTVGSTWTSECRG
jgi:hypothetical protein